MGHVRTYPKDVLDGFNFRVFPPGSLPPEPGYPRPHRNSLVGERIGGALHGRLPCRQAAARDCQLPPGPFHGEIAVAWHLCQGHSAGTRRAHHRRSARGNPRVDRRPHRRGARGRKGVELAVGVRSKSDWRVRVPLVQCKQRRRLLDATTAALRQGGPAWLQCSYIQSDVERSG